MSFNKVINHKVIINAPVAMVWRALTDPALMKHWLWENEVEVISEWQPGSLMLFKSTFHDIPYIDKGKILDIEKEKIFRYIYWSHLSQLADEPENYQHIEFKLVAEKECTELSLKCSNLINTAIYGHWNFYWAVTLDILKHMLESRKLTT